MAGFNTLPTKTVAGAAATAVSTGQNLIPPVLVRENYDTDARFANQMNGNRMEGFIGDGDYIELPIIATGNLIYFNNLDVQQFSISRTTVAGTAEDWVGFTFDKTDSLIYVVVVSEGENPNLYFLASIDQAGTIVNIGTGQPSVDFNFPTTTWWTINAATQGSSSLQRAADGSGNMFVRQTNTVNPGMQEMEINITNGAIVSDPSDFDNDLDDVAWKTQSGVYYSIDNVGSQVFFHPVTKFNRIVIVNSQNFGWFATTGNKMLQWKGRMVETASTSTARQGSRIAVQIETFDAWVDLVVKTYGFG